MTSATQIPPKKKEIQEFTQREECPCVSLWMYTLPCCQKHLTHSDLMKKHKWRSRIKDASFPSGMRGVVTVPTSAIWSIPVPTACSSCRAQPALPCTFQGKTILLPTISSMHPNNSCSSISRSPRQGFVAPATAPPPLSEEPYL